MKNYGSIAVESYLASLLAQILDELYAPENVEVAKIAMHGFASEDHAALTQFRAQTAELNERQTGRTTKLVEEATRTGAVFVVIHSMEASRIKFKYPKLKSVVTVHHPDLIDICSRNTFVVDHAVWAYANLKIIRELRRLAEKHK